MSDPFADAAADILASVGVSAVYTPSGGDPIATMVRITRSLGTFGEFDHLQESEHVATVLRHDAAGVNGVGATPGSGDTIEITDADSVHSGTAFTVREEVEGDSYTARLAVR